MGAGQAEPTCVQSLKNAVKSGEEFWRTEGILQ